MVDVSDRHLEWVRELVVSQHSEADSRGWGWNQPCRPFPEEL